MSGSPDGIRDALVDADMLIKRLSVGSLYAFVVGAMPHVLNCEITEAPHIRLICGQLERMSRAEIRNLVIAIPPGNMKSMLASVMFPSWIWLRDPSATFMALSGTPDAASRDSRRMRRLVLSDWYQSIVEMQGEAWSVRMTDGGNVLSGTSIDLDRKRGPKKWSLTKDQNTKMNFENTLGGARMCLSLNSNVTGNRAKFIIVDDAIDVKSARIGSVDQIRKRMQEVNEKVGELDTRKPMSGGFEIRIAQRLHDLDPIGTVIDSPDWERIIMQAEYDPGFKYNHPLDWRTERGQPIDPIRQPFDDLQAKRRKLGEASYATQYLQTPVSRGSTLFSGRLDHIAYEGPPSVKADVAEAIIISVDAAEKTGSSNDYSACTVWAKIGVDYYLVGGWCKKLKYLDLVEQVRATMVEFDEYHAVLIEDKSNGTALIQALNEHYHGIVPVNPSRNEYAQRKVARNKTMRATSSTLVCMQAGHVHVPAPHHLVVVDPWRDHHEAFPMGTHDDMVDSTSQAIEYLQYMDREDSDSGYDDAWDAIMGIG